MITDSFIFRKAWRDAVKNLKYNIRVSIYEAIIEYALTGEEQCKLNHAASTVFNIIKSYIDEDKAKAEAIRLKRSKAGKKGGAPKGNSNARKNKQNKQMLDLLVSGEEKRDSETSQRTDSEDVEGKKQAKQAKQANACSDSDSCVYKNDNIIISSHSKHTVDINKKKTTSTKVELVKEKESTAPPIAPLMARMEKFYNELIPFVDKYGKELIRNFYDYWSEPNRSKTKMRYELQPTWDIRRRLATWAKKDKNYTTNGNRANITTAERSVNDAAALVQRLLRTNK